MPWSTEDLIYAAALIDGEGSVVIQRHTASFVAPRVQCAMTTKSVIYWLNDTFGGYAGPNKLKEGRKPSWQWALTGKHCVPFLTAILPYLKIKHEQAKLCLAYLQTTRNPGRDGYTVKETVVRQAIVDKVKFLNQRGAA
jgi:hypothetical protein